MPKVSMRRDVTTTPADVDGAVARFHEFGLVALQGDATHVPQWKATADSTLARYLALAASKSGAPLGIGKEHGFRELVKKDPARIDLNFDHPVDADAAAFIDALRGAMLQRIAPVLDKVLGPGYKLNGQGIVVSSEGAPQQRWHVDSSHLFVGDAQLPCHFVTCFMPLFTAVEAIGPTEFCPGSQHATGFLGNSIVAEQYPPDQDVARIVSTAGRGTMTLDCNPGDVLVMDGRLLHRGQGNRNPGNRHLVYVSFCRPWYYEWPRSQDDARSLAAPPSKL